jgi:PKD repeat protein
MRNKIISSLFVGLFIILSVQSYCQQDYYWVNGDGYWHDAANHWSKTSNNSGGIMHSVPPTITDNVFFDQFSFSDTLQRVILQDISIPPVNPVCNNMDWTGALHQPTIIGVDPISIYGNLKLIPNMNFKPTATYFRAINKIATVTTAGQPIPTSCYFDGNNGTWILQDDLEVQGTLFHFKGNLDANQNNITCNYFNSDPLNQSNLRSLNIDNSILTIMFADGPTPTGNAILSCNINNDFGTMNISALGNSKILFLGQVYSLSTMKASRNLNYNYVEFMGEGRLYASHSNFNYTLFHGNGTLYVDTCAFDTVNIYHLGLDYSNSCYYNRLLFSTYPSNWCSCCDDRNHDYGLLEGNNNHIEKIVDFHRNGTIKGSNNFADTSRFYANGNILTGSNQFQKVIMQRHWPVNCNSCWDNYGKNTLTLEKNKVQTINDSIILFGDYHCQHTRITTTDSANQATIVSQNNFSLNYVELLGINAQNSVILPDIAKRSLDLGNNANWNFQNNYNPLVISGVNINPVNPCSYSLTGSVTISATGAEPPYTYWEQIGTVCGGWRINTPGDNNVFTALSKGVHTFRVMDAYQCVATDTTIYVGGPDPVIIDSVRVIPVPCLPVPSTSNGGQIKVYAHGGTGILQYSINNGGAWQNGNIFNQVNTTGNYYVKVRDAVACTTNTVPVTMTKRPDLNLIDQTPAIINCWGDSTGILKIQIWGGMAPYNLQIIRVSGGSLIQTPISVTIPTETLGNPDIFLVRAGLYDIIVTDNNGCLVTSSRQIFEKPKLDFTSTKETTPGPPTTYCLEVMPSGGQPPYDHLWNNGATTAKICGLVPGFWCDTITDDLGCRDTACILIEPLSITMTSDTVCYGECDGFICVIPSGGSTPYSYSWSNGGTTPCINNLCKGDYIVTVTDASGGIVIDTTTVYENLEIIATFVVDTVLCNGGSTGAITATVTGGKPFQPPALYHYNWSNSGTTSSITGIGAGIYKLTVTDSKPCDRVFTIIMPQPPPIGITFSTWSDDQCATYKAMANVTGGNSGYNYLWSNNQTTNPATGLSAGTYTVTVTDRKGCAKVASVVITPLSVSTTFTDITCYGVCDGTATATVTGGNAPYLIIWRKLPSGPVITACQTTPSSSMICNLCDGSYEVTVTDANNCSVTKTVTITQPVYSLQIVTLTYTQMLNCNGDCNGTATAWASGGTPAYTYKWSKQTTPWSIIGTAQTISGLCAGQYCVTVTDSRGCQADSCFLIDQPAGISFTDSVVNIACFTDGDAGKIFISNTSGGTPPYVFSIHCPGSGFQGSNVFTGLPPGSYQIGVMDSKGCKSACKTVNITRPPALNLTLIPVNPGGFGLCNGSVTATASGGMPPYTHHWYKSPAVFIKTDVLNPSTLSGLCVGTYIDTVTDGNGCKKWDSVTLYEPSALTIQVDSTNISCFGMHDGSIDLTISGGIPPYSVFYNGQTTILSTLPYIFSINNLDAGNYTFVVKDKNLNTAIRTVVIIEPLPIIINFQDTIVCHGANNGWIEAFPAQGTPPYTSYLWSNGATTKKIQNLNGNQWYTVTVTDSRQCQARDSVFLEENPPLFVVINKSDTSVCKNDSLQMNVAAFGGIYPYSFQWSPVAGVSNPAILQPWITLSFGETYLMTMTDSKGCQAKDSITITVDSLPSAGFTYDQECQSRTVSFTNTSFGYPIGSLTYLWDFGDINQSTATNPVHTYTGNIGSYSVSLTVTTPAGCTDDTLVPITINPSIQVNFQADTACLGDSTQLWAQSLNPATTVNRLKWYFDNNPPVIVSPPPLDIWHTFSYAGAHTVKLVMEDTITDCSDSITKPVVVLQSPATEFTYTWHCTSDTVWFTDLTPGAGTGPTYYEWDFGQPGPGNISNLQNPTHIYSFSGDYTVKLTVTFSYGSGKACSFTKIKQLHYIKSPQAAYSFANPCFGQTTQFSDLSFAATGNIVLWKWDFDDLPSGLLNTSGFQNPAHTFTAPGTYHVKLNVYDNTLCHDSVIHTVIIHAPPVANFQPHDTCMGEIAFFDDLSIAADTTISQWVWDFGDGTPLVTYTSYQANVMHLYSLQGTYTVKLTVTDKNGCSQSKTKLINIHPAPTAMFQFSPACANQVTWFTDFSNGSGSQIVEWNWNFGDIGGINNTSTLQNPSHTYPSTGSYNVTLCVKNSLGCINCYTQAITIYPSPVASFSADTACKGTPTHFQNLSYCLGDNINSWEWNFGDGTGSTNVQWPVHTFTSAGTFNVSLVVTTLHGCTADTVIPVVVHENPVANFSYASPGGTSCFILGDSTHFTDLSTITGGNIINHWQWNFGDGGSSTEQNPVHKFTIAGTYFVTLSVMDIHGCQNTIIKPVILSEGPMASYTYTISQCDSVSFINHSVSVQLPVVSWFWDFDDVPSGVNNFSTEENPAHHFYTPVTKTYHVKLIVTDSLGCSDTLIGPVTVSKPVANFRVENSCIGEGTTFFDLSVSDSNFIASWSWDFGDPLSGSNSSTLQNPVHIYNSAGDYFVILTVTNGNGCVATIGKTIHVSYPPSANWSYIQPSCYPDATHFLDISVPQGTVPITNWLWDFGDGSTSTLKNPVHQYAAAGSYTVVLIVKNADSCQDDYSYQFNYYPGPTAAFSHDPVLKCRKAVVTFNDLSVATFGNVSSWNWDFGDGSTHSLIANPTHVYQTAGPFTVTLIVSDERGCSDTISHDILINELPFPDFTADTACLGSSTLFNNLTTGNDNSWLWDFGEPIQPLLNNSTGKNPSHTYLNAGNFFVRLTVTNGNNCVKDTLKKVTVVPLPVVNFSNSSPCSGQLVQFTDQSIVYQGTIKHWHWDFGDPLSGTSNTDTTQNPTHVFSLATTYNVTLTITSTGNCPPATFTQQVTIRPAPVVNFLYTSACYGESVHFNDATNQNGGTSLVTWLWDFGDPLSGLGNTSTLPNPYHLFSGTGPFPVRLIVTNADGCSDTLTKTVIIHPKPGVEFTYGPACASDTVCFNVNGTITPIGAIVSYRWDLNGDGFDDSFLPNPCYFYTTPGLVNVTLTVVDTNGCENSKSHLVDVSPQPIANFLLTGPNCFGMSVDFTDYSTPVTGYIATWIWNFDDGSGDITINYPASANISHTFPGFGPYNVSLRVITTGGCTDTIVHNITLESSPTANFTYSAPCAGSQVQFTDISTATGGIMISSWSWDFGDPTSGSNNISTIQNPVHTYLFPGTYPVRLVITNLNNCIDTLITWITVNELPVANFSADTVCAKNPMSFTDLSIANASGNIFAHVWDFGDGGTSTLVNPTYVYNTHGIFNVKLTVTNSNGCKKDTTIQVLVRPLPIAAFSFPGDQCSNSAICFTDHSTTPSGYLGYITQWRWEFGDGSPAVTRNFPANPNVCHTFSGNALSHDVKLKITTSDGCSDSIIHTVISLPHPVANFSYSTVTCENQPVCFTDLSQLNGGVALTSWHWDFGDPLSGSSNTSTLSNPCHTFSSPGNYVIHLIVTNSDNCSDTSEVSIVINPAPVASFVADTACAGSATQFNSSSSVSPGSIINSWSWNFGDGGSSTLPAPLYTFLNYGTYNVTLTIVNANGCSHSVTNQVKVNPKPIPAFSFSQASCVGDTVIFTDHSFIPAGFSGFIQQWIWNFDDGTSQVFNFPHPPNVPHVFQGNATTHNVTLTVITSEGCRDSISKIVNSIPSPIAGFNHSSVTCLGQSVQFNDLSQPNGGGSIQTRSWNFGDILSGTNNTSTLMNPQHTFSGQGKYKVTLRVTSANGCTGTWSDSVTIHGLPTANFTHTNDCKGSEVSFDGSSSIPNNSAIVSYSWKFGDGGNAAGINALHTFLTEGIYNVTLTVADFNGCSADTVKQVTVYPTPVPLFTASESLCDGTPVQFTNHSYLPFGFPGYINKWVWYWGDGTSTTINHPNNPNVSHTFPKGVYHFNVKLVVSSNFGCTDSISKQVTLIPTPVSSFEVLPGTPTCANQPVQFHDLSQTNGGGIIAEWLWDFGDPGSGTNNSSIASGPSHIFNLPGMYNVILKVTNVNGCSDRDTIPVVIATKPIANFKTDTVCAGSNTHFTDLSLSSPGIAITSYSWNFGYGGATSTQPSPQYSYPDPGTYNATLTIINANGCTHSVTKSVLVTSPPVADFEVSQTSCLGQPVYFTDHSYIPSGYASSIKTWTWKFGDGTSQTITGGSGNTSHTYTGPGTTYDVWLIITTTSNCVDSISTTVISWPAPLSYFSYSAATCIGQTVQFNDLTQPNGGGSIQSREWNFGDPLSGTANISTLQNPTHNFTTTGNHTVTLTVKNQNGCIHHHDTVITIHPLPVANFMVTGNTCTGSLITFDAASSIANAGITGTITNYWWEFGTGGTAATQPAQFSFNAPGTYQVTLTVTNSNGCIHSVTKPVIVNPKPIVNFAVSSLKCIGSPITFTDQSFIPPGYSGIITSWTWNFDDGGTSTSQHPTHTFSGPGTTFNVTLTVTTSWGCMDSISKIVTVNPAPVANFTTTSPYCAGRAVQFTDQSVTNGGGAIQTWSWNFGDPLTGTANYSTAQSPGHTFSGAGSYTITFIVTNANGCKDTLLPLPQVVIKARPLANFTADTVCLGSLTEFNDISTTPVPGIIDNRVWDFGDGSTSFVTPVFHQFSTAGNHAVKLTVTNSSGCQKDTTKQVLVLDKPVVLFTFSTPTCAGDSVQFTDLSFTSHGSIKSWKWDFGDNSPAVTINFPGNQNVKHKYVTGGDYSVTLTIKTSDSCEAYNINTVVVHVTSNPLANFSWDNYPCPGQLVSFQNLSQPNGGTPITNWNWNFGDPSTGVLNTSTDPDPQHAFSASGTYHVRLTVTNSTGCIDSVPGGKTVTVNSAPVAKFTVHDSCFGSPTSFTDLSTPAGSITSWAWNFDDPGSGSLNTATIPNPTHTFTMEKTYHVILTVTNSNQCPKDTMIPVTIYPKPISGFTFSSSCQNSTTYFYNQSSPFGSIENWKWDFGDGTVISGPNSNPTHVYSSAGNHQVKLVVKNFNGCSDSVTQSVVTRPQPVAAFTYASKYCTAGEVHFTSTSQGINGASVIKNSWVLEPGGDTINGPTPSYIYNPTNMKYWVNLVVMDNYHCMDTIADSIFVKPGWGFTLRADTVCEGLTTHLFTVNLAPGDVLSPVSWNFGDPNSFGSNTSTSFNPTHTFTKAGIYNVKLKAQNSDNCVDSIYKEVRVWAPPKPLFTYSALPCDSVLHFTDSTQTIGDGPIASWRWTWGDGTNTIITPGPGDTSHTYSTPNIYPVTLTMTTIHGCHDSVTRQDVQRFPCIMAGFAYADTLCARNEIAFSDTSLPIARINQWKWHWGDGKPDNIYTQHTSPVYHVFDTCGTFPVTLEVQANVNGKTITDNLSALVNIKCTPRSYFANPPTCLNQITLFQDTSKTFGLPTTKRKWHFSEDPKDTTHLANPAHLYDSAGIYNVKLVVGNKYGCIDSLTKPTRVYSLPVAKYESQFACSGDSAAFTDLSAEGDTTIKLWSWFFGDPVSKKDTSSKTNPKYRYMTAGTYPIKMVIQDLFGCRDTIDSTLHVNQSPIASFTMTEGIDGTPGKIRLNNESSYKGDFFWKFGNGKTNYLEENPTIKYDEDGLYEITLIVTDSNGCVDSTVMKYEFIFDNLYVPNAFNPTFLSGDASVVDDVRKFKPKGRNLEEYHVMVFDKWGHLLWESSLIDCKDPSVPPGKCKGRPVEGWDGTYNGQPMPQDVYMWRISARFKNGKVWEGSDSGTGAVSTMGTVTLIR